MKDELVRAKLEAAKKLLKEAEAEWGQPLYYDEEGYSVDPVAQIELTIERLDD